MPPKFTKLNLITEKKANSLTLENLAIPKAYTRSKVCNKRISWTSSGNSINFDTSNLSNFVDLYLQPFVIKFVNKKKKKKITGIY